MKFLKAAAAVISNILMIVVLVPISCMRRVKAK